MILKEVPDGMISKNEAVYKRCKRRADALSKLTDSNGVSLFPKMTATEYIDYFKALLDIENLKLFNRFYKEDFALYVYFFIINRGYELPLSFEALGTSYPLNTDVAKAMIEEGEKLIVDLIARDKVSREEYNKFVLDIADAYDGYTDVKWGYLFFYNDEVDDNKTDTLRIKNDFFYPTIYHRDIEIVSAIITNRKELPIIRVASSSSPRPLAIEKRGAPPIPNRFAKAMIKVIMGRVSPRPVMDKVASFGIIPI